MSSPAFQPFDPRKPVRVYRRNLPHWRQDGATYFVTFRLADSIPAAVAKQWGEEDRIWREANQARDGLTERAEQSYHRRVVRRLHLELDRCHGACLLRRPNVREIVASALHHFDRDRWWIGDFVLMPNHIHALMQPMPGFALEEVLASVKGYTSTRLTALGAKSGRLWQQENYDHIVRDRAELSLWRGYIRDNPKKAKLREVEFTYFRCDWLD